MIEKFKTWFEEPYEPTGDVDRMAIKLNEIIEWINEQEAHNIKVKEDLDKYMQERKTNEY